METKAWPDRIGLPTVPDNAKSGPLKQRREYDGTLASVRMAKHAAASNVAAP